MTRALALDRPVHPPKLLAELWDRLGVAGTCTATELRVLEAPPGTTEADLRAVLEAHDATPVPAPWCRRKRFLPRDVKIVWPC